MVNMPDQRCILLQLITTLTEIKNSPVKEVVFAHCWDSTVTSCC